MPCAWRCGCERLRSNNSRVTKFDINETIGEYVSDLIAANAIVVDAKTIDGITDREIGQVLNYLKITSLRVGMILNFKHSKLQWKRVVL